MPRFYDLQIIDPTTKKIATRADGSQIRWTTNPTPQVYDPGALNVEFDVIVSEYATPTGGHGITVHGVALGDLQQASVFAGTSPGNGMILNLYGGMTQGLPLVTPKQAGLLVSGVITQSFGNWVGTEMTIDFVVAPSTYTPDNPGNLVLTWRDKTKLSTAIATTLSVAYPGVKQNIAISDQLVLSHDEVGFWPTLEAMSSSIMNITEGFLGADYPGVSIAYQSGQLYVYDGTILNPPSAINFNDLVGQPTYIDVNLMQMVTVLRSDLQIASVITMPLGLQAAPGIVQTTAQSAPNGLKYKSSFQGQFLINQVRHIGNLRAPDGQSWISVFNCVPTGTTSATSN